MKVIVEIPDSLAAIIPDVSRLPRLILEAYCSEKFRGRLLSREDVGLILGHDQDRTADFLKANDLSCEADSADGKSQRAPLEKTA